jgi:hypothetical protein
VTDLPRSPGHVVLLGDSVFDNGAYVAAGPDVATQLRQALPAGWRATLLARDGAVAADLPQQIARLPADARHLLVSLGGNDALGHLGVLDEPVGSVAEALERLAGIRDSFRADYLDAVTAVLGLGLPAWLCTIYEPRFPEPEMQRVAIVALSIFNDVITRAVSAQRLNLLDLRVLFDDGADYANPIEPSVQGGGKIARAIVQRVAGRCP